MTWFAPSDLQTRLTAVELIQLSTGEGRGTAPDEVILQEVLDRAELEVRGVLQGRATLPETLDPSILRDAALDLAVEFLFLRQKGAAAKLSDGWAARVKRARALLDSMMTGDIPIPSVRSSRRFAAINPPSSVDGAFR